MDGYGWVWMVFFVVRDDAVTTVKTVTTTTTKTIERG